MVIAAPKGLPAGRGFMTPAGFPTSERGGLLARILTDPSEKALVDAIEQNCVDFFMEYGRGPGCEVHTERGVTWFATGVPHPLFNGVMTAHLGPADIDGRIDDLIREFQERRLPLEWTVGSSTVPQDLGRRLEAKGLNHVLRVPGMAIDLRSLPDESLPNDLTIEPVRDRAALEAAIRIALTTFDIPVEFTPRLAAIEQGMPRDHAETAQAFLGSVRGEAVATSMAFLSGGVAGVYFVGTLGTFRGRGIGRAMTTAALRWGRERGYRIGTLQATPMGLPVYRRLGFRAYSEFGIYS